ncbi:dTMP kinase [Commensalibacter papalotli (ex Botero et al. 2024)]|uniref:Thymidylate kinase n=1 Tax=Commensalibacter papalotli (ex Botero et al. 2024) TaxID=2972766 RepID=A0ABM9HHQ0_9PROT|nr:dTMP kinase [Commensalibacter papalotli (ex Botero et al. 2024)]CAI3922784.1 Thymidylate kinase (Tmk) (PDB:3LV8) [Commensalibacter papalotli (ex Botero et al. 2024)]CAI3929460.1 Thymidylate kinase (Tmk) (PDB:3LV8) [Commensalibacter papalotli (ex Botero et al. 2024)]
MTGYMITFEGGEGAGKSTQAQRLYEAFEREGRKVLLTREPGGTKGAEAIRELLLFGGYSFSLRSEIMAHFTARCDHVDQIIKPALSQGYVVICDRYIDSTKAYQGYGLGNGDKDLIRYISNLSDLIALQPDLTLIFEAPYDIMRERCCARQGRVDRYEQLDENFHYRVLNGFKQIMMDNSDRCVRIDAHRNMEAIHQDVYDIVSQKLFELKQ